MSAPERFVLSEFFRHHSPDKVRAAARRHGFTLAVDVCEEEGSSKSDRERRNRTEIWAKADHGDAEGPNPGGYWIIRIDAQGHRDWFHGRRPHYHKNWVPSHLLRKYLRQYTRGAYAYDDSGQLLGRVGDCNHPGSLAKGQHIPR